MCIKIYIITLYILGSRIIQFIYIEWLNMLYSKNKTVGIWE